MGVMQSVFLILAMLAATPLPAVEALPAKFVAAHDGGRIAYYAVLEANTVPVIVLSGGPGTDSRYMRARGALDRLSKIRSVVFYDRRGTSRSVDSDGSETIDQYVEDIEAIRSAVNAPRLDSLGHSCGGYLAMAYTARHPQRVRSLILVDSSAPKAVEVKQLLPEVSPERIEAWRAKRATLGKHASAEDLAMFQRMEFVDAVAMSEFLEDVRQHRSNLDVNNTLRKDMANRDYWPQVRQFRHPSLVILGRHDAVIAPANSWAWHQALQDSTFHIIEAAGHFCRMLSTPMRSST